MRRSLGNFTRVINQPTSIPLLCNCRKRCGSEQKLYEITSATRRSWSGYYSVTDRFISQWGVIPYAEGTRVALRQRDSCLSSTCRSIAKASKKSLLSAPWSIFPTVALMAEHTATDVLSAMPTCMYKSKILPFMINSCTYYKCRAFCTRHF